jgi:hypothetical protein
VSRPPLQELIDAVKAADPEACVFHGDPLRDGTPTLHLLLDPDRPHPCFCLYFDPRVPGPKQYATVYGWRDFAGALAECLRFLRRRART